MGVAVAVGAGIFSVGAKAPANFSGPAVTVSFALAAVIAKYWGIYLSKVFALMGADVPAALSIGGVDLYWGAFLIVAAFALLVLGTKLSARVGNIFTLIKVGVVLFVIVVGFTYVKLENYSPFIPAAEQVFCWRQPPPC